MRRHTALALIAVCALTLFAAPRWSQDNKKDGGRVRITIYRIAPGKHLDFLKWLAVQDEVAKEAGVATVQLYAHLDGDSWDYLGIGPATSPEQDKKLDEIMARKGFKTGFPAAIASAIWYAFLAFAGYTLADNWSAVKELVASANRVLGVAALLTTTLLAVWLWRRSRRGKRPSGV